MTHRNRLLPLVVAMALALSASYIGAQDAPDFKAGDNTWGNSKVGDWVQYRLKDGPSVRFEVTAIAENGDITFQHTIYNAEGEVMADNSRTRAPAQCPVQQKVPADKDVTWGEASFPLEVTELKCQRATWLSEKSKSEVWFHETIPCGGVAKTATDGADSVWVTAFKRDGKEYRLAEKTEPEDNNAVDFSTGETTWSRSVPGDWVLYRSNVTVEVRVQLLSITDNGEFRYARRLDTGDFGEDRKIIDKTYERSGDRIKMPVRLPFGREFVWTKATRQFGDRKLQCQVAKWTDDDGTVNSAWFSSEVPCGGGVLWTSGETTVEELVGFGREEIDPESIPEPEPEPQPEPEPEPEPEPGPEPLPEFGEPITMKLPEKVAKAMKDQGLAITRMRIYFDEKAGNEGAVLEYEGMRTEVPVIYAAFNGDECDLELSYAEWQRRDGRYVDLGFEVKTQPKKLKDMQVKIVHTHLTGEEETELATYGVTVPEAGERWDAVRLRGALPGINRYTLLVTYKDSKGEETTQKGFSHWVVVQSPPMFEFLNSVSATGSRMDAGANTVLEGDVRMRSNFILHHGIDSDDCTLRITRKGKRDMNLEDLPAEVRRVIAKEKIPPGWQEVARVDFEDGTLNGRRVVDIEDSFITVDWGHAFAASAKVLPVTEDWEYRFELLHKDSALPLATWNVTVGLSITRPTDITTAAMTVRATGLDEPLKVAFKKK